METEILGYVIHMTNGYIINHGHGKSVQWAQSLSANFDGHVLFDMGDGTILYFVGGNFLYALS